LSYSARATTRAAVENCDLALDSRESPGRETRQPDDEALEPLGKSGPPARKTMLPR
jgi:hypothetical protein